MATMLLDSCAGVLLHHQASSPSPSCTATLVASSSPTLPWSNSRLSIPSSSGLRRLVSSPRSTPSPTRSPRRASQAIVSEQQQETLAPVGAVTDKTWKALVLESDIPVLVDFWAPWCGPCRMIAPLVDQLSAKYAGRLRCLKLNTDESPSTATEYGIRSIPTVMIFKQGIKKETIIGAVPMAALITAVEKFLDR